MDKESSGYPAHSPVKFLSFIVFSTWTPLSLKSDLSFTVVIDLIIFHLSVKNNKVKVEGLINFLPLKRGGGRLVREGKRGGGGGGGGGELNRGFTVIGKCRSLCVETRSTYDVIISRRNLVRRAFFYKLEGTLGMRLPFNHIPMSTSENGLVKKARENLDESDFFLLESLKENLIPLTTPEPS